ncbi:MAG: DUF1802 family protein [Methanobacteriaceae archaeon]|nr:DUF1802 family protein [Methanobacteriaceae archaeon]
MVKIKKCLNEWNATVEALGQGKQSILIRKYKTNLQEFILYPTISYALKEGSLDSFKKEYQSFVEENALPTIDDKKMEIKYYARLEAIIEKPITRIGGLSKFHIWTNDHVKSYLHNKKGFVWILRVHKLKEPIMAERTRGMRYANLLEEVSLEGIKPVLSDSEFDEILKEI